MAEPPASQEAVTYYANIVSTHVFADEIVMEFRRFIRSHKEVFETIGPGKPIPPPDDATVYKTPPIVRVVLTFTAAKALKEYLDKTIPVIETQRKA